MQLIRKSVLHQKTTEGFISEFSQADCRFAIKDLINNLPRWERDYQASLRDFILSLYQKIASDSQTTVFIDKTPRYSLILPFLKELFPDTRFIFLLPSPLYVLTSIIGTYHDNEFRPDLVNRYVDFVTGPAALKSGYNQLKYKSIAVDYASLVEKPEEHLRKFCPKDWRIIEK